MRFQNQKRRIGLGASCAGRVVTEFVLPMFTTHPGKEGIFLAESEFTPSVAPCRRLPSGHYLLGTSIVMAGYELAKAFGRQTFEEFC